MARTKSKAKRHSVVSHTLLLVVLANLLQSSLSALHGEASKDRWSLDSLRRGVFGLRGNPKRQQIIPNCGEMVSRSQCSQDPKCRWCKSEALDDMCFTNAEAWRLPQQCDENHNNDDWKAPMDTRSPITQANDVNHKDDGWKAPMDAKSPFQIPKGPITRARAKTIKEALNGLIKDIQAHQASNGANSSLTKSRGLINIIGVLDGP